MCFKKEIVEVGFAEFKSAIISSKDKCIESIKKEPEGSDFNSSICLKWWRLGDCLARSRLTAITCFVLGLNALTTKALQPQLTRARTP